MFAETCVDPHVKCPLLLLVLPKIGMSKGMLVKFPIVTFQDNQFSGSGVVTCVGNLPHGGFASSDRAPLFLTNSGPAVWGATGLGFFTLATWLTPPQAYTTCSGTPLCPTSN
jgi:hypothetical protein